MSRLPDGVRIGRVALSVGDLHRATSFYADIAGLAVRQQTEQRTHLGAGGEELLVLRSTPDEPPRPSDAAGLFHTAFLYPSRNTLAAALARVRQSWRLTGASDHLVSEALYLDDPDGNGVELYRDRPREAWPMTPDGGVRMDTRPLDLADLAGSPGSSETESPNLGAPPGTRIGHVHLEVTDLGRARAFYVDTLGFDITFQTRGALFVSAGGYHHHVGLNVWNRRSAPATGRGLDRFELTFPNYESVTAAADRLRSGGYEANELDQGITTHDPDGIEVALVVEE